MKATTSTEDYIWAEVGAHFNRESPKARLIGTTWIPKSLTRTICTTKGDKKPEEVLEGTFVSHVLVPKWYADKTGLSYDD